LTGRKIEISKNEFSSKMNEKGIAIKAQWTVKEGFCIGEI
jgi:hypothetical protein